MYNAKSEEGSVAAGPCTIGSKKKKKKKQQYSNCVCYTNKGGYETDWKGSGEGDGVPSKGLAWRIIPAFIHPLLQSPWAVQVFGIASVQKA